MKSGCFLMSGAQNCYVNNKTVQLSRRGSINNHRAHFASFSKHGGLVPWKHFSRIFLKKNERSPFTAIYWGIYGTTQYRCNRKVLLKTELIYKMKHVQLRRRKAIPTRHMMDLSYVTLGSWPFIRLRDPSAGHLAAPTKSTRCKPINHLQDTLLSIALFCSDLNEKDGRRI